MIEKIKCTFSAIGNLRILFSNVNILNKERLDELKCRIKEMKQDVCHIIALQEVNPNHRRYEWMLEEYDTEGYEMIGKNSPCQNDRGLIVYLMVRLDFVNILSKSPYREYICLKINQWGRKIVIYLSL